MLNINHDYLPTSARNPFDTPKPTVFSLGLDAEWVGYTFGSLFLAIGITCFFFYPRTLEKMRNYKAEQLANFNVKYNRKETDYDRTGMYVPAWERAKASMPIFLGIIFCFIGLAWIVGNTLSTL